MPVSYVVTGGSRSSYNPKLEEATEDDSLDAEVLQSLIQDCIQDEQKVSILSWLAAEPAVPPSFPTRRHSLSIRTLDTAVALFAKPECSSLAELNEHRPQLTEESLNEGLGKVIKIVKTGYNDIVFFRNKTAKDLFIAHRRLFGSRGLDFLAAKACVTYLSLDDFRDLPLPIRSKGCRSDLKKSDPFLSYASRNWHRFIHSAEDAMALEPRLGRIINPAMNNVYLWTDRCRSASIAGGSRRFFRNPAEIAVKYDIDWLVPHLLESMHSQPEDMFPARHLSTITREAPSVLKYLLSRKPEYYRPSINREVLMEAASPKSRKVDTLRILLAEDSHVHLPSAFLGRVARKPNGDEIFDFLFSRKDIPITSRMVAAAAANEDTGSQMLKKFFDRDPSIRVNADMLTYAIKAQGVTSLRILLEHDPGAQITAKVLEAAINGELKPVKLKLLLDARPDSPIPRSVVERAVECNREETVKLLFNTYGYLKMDETLARLAAFGHSCNLGMAEFLFDRCDPGLITEDVLLHGVRRWNCPDKMVALLLKYNPQVPISDQVLLESARDWDGRTSDVLLKHRGGDQVPNKLVDDAIRVKKSRLSRSFLRSKKEDLLRTLQERVPNDPYLQKKLAETDFTPPPPPPDERPPRPQDVPDAAKKSDLARLRELLDEGFDIDTLCGSTCSCDRNQGRGTALQRAVKQRDIEMTKLLLERGANTNLQDGKFGNPLQEAARAGDMELVQLLAEHDADVNLLGGNHQSPLIAAAKADAANIVRYLIVLGADINIADDNGWTPYVHAVACESHDAIRALLEADSSLPALGELIALPPGKLVKVKNNSAIGLDDDGLIFNTNATDQTELSQRILLRADHPIIPTSSFYFEITILRHGSSDRPGSEKIIALGISTLESLQASPSKTGMPGCADGSWGYHGNDGRALDEGDHDTAAAATSAYPTYGAVGDIIGCGVDRDLASRSRSVYFTKNGVRLGGKQGVAFHMIETGLLYPVIGVGTEGMEVAVNFGDGTAFAYPW